MNSNYTVQRNGSKTKNQQIPESTPDTRDNGDHLVIANWGNKEGDLFKNGRGGGGNGGRFSKKKRTRKEEKERKKERKNKNGTGRAVRQTAASLPIFQTRVRRLKGRLMRHSRFDSDFYRVLYFLSFVFFVPFWTPPGFLFRIWDLGLYCGIFQMNLVFFFMVLQRIYVYLLGDVFFNRVLLGLTGFSSSFTEFFFVLLCFALVASFRSFFFFRTLPGFLFQIWETWIWSSSIGFNAVFLGLTWSFFRGITKHLCLLVLGYLYWVLLVFDQVWPSFTPFHRVSLRYYSVLKGFTGLYTVLMVSTTSLSTRSTQYTCLLIGSIIVLILLGCWWVWLSFTWFSPSFTGFHKVGLHLIGFHQTWHSFVWCNLIFKWYGYLRLLIGSVVVVSKSVGHCGRFHWEVLGLLCYIEVLYGLASR